MFLVFIPDGAEATVYALLSTWLNLASELSIGLGTILACSFFRTSNADLIDHHWGGVIDLTWITSAVQLLPIAFVYAKIRGIDCLPDGRRETRAQYDPERSSWYGAVAFVTVYMGSIAAALTEGIILISDPNSCQ